MRIKTAEHKTGTALAAITLTFLSSCASDSYNRRGSINNPFGYYYSSGPNADNIVLRSKKGDRSVEVELSGRNGQMTDFIMPVSPAFRDQAPTALGSGNGLDDRYREAKPSLTDREITRTLPQGNADEIGDRREIEAGLGVVPTEEDKPQGDTSYLASVDRVKQLFRSNRYEAALLELDELIRTYPTDPKLYEMRGTLLDRTGRGDLALRSWSQALRLDPANQSLKRFVDRKQQGRKIASPTKE